MSRQIDRLRGTRRAGFVLAACVVLAVLAFLLPRALAPGEIELVHAEAPRATWVPDLVLADAPRIVEPEMPTEDRTPIDTVRPTIRRKPNPITAATTTPSGRLHVRAVDAATFVALDRIRVRAVSATRLADRSSGPLGLEVGMILTPDSYAILVLVPGYEPAELGPVSVTVGASVDLPAVLMRAGSARILGTVNRSLDPGEALSVELMGNGRRPCAQCSERFVFRPTDSSRGSSHREDPCARCGFAPDCSRLPVAPAGVFAFDALTSGTYALRLVDGRGHDVGEQVSVQLLDAECERVAIDAPRPRTVHVELIDTDGVSLAAAWGANVRYREAVANRHVEPLDWRFDFLADQGDTRTGTFPVPTAPGTTSARPSPFGSRKLGSSGKRTVDDRPRRDGQALQPEPDEPRFERSPIGVSVDGNGLVAFEGVPARELRLVLNCGAFRAAVDLTASSEPTQAEARLTVDVVAQEAGATTFRALDAARYR